MADGIRSSKEDCEVGGEKTEQGYGSGRGIGRRTDLPDSRKKLPKGDVFCRKNSGLPKVFYEPRKKSGDVLGSCLQKVSEDPSEKKVKDVFGGKRSDFSKVPDDCTEEMKDVRLRTVPDDGRKEIKEVTIFSGKKDVLCILWDRKILGIDLGKLLQLEEAKNWKSCSEVSSAPFDYSLDLPEKEDPVGMHHFVLDSKVYMLSGVIPQDRNLPGDVYELVLEPHASPSIRLSKPDSIPCPPTSLAGSKVASILGKLYFLRISPDYDDAKHFMVLDSTQEEEKMWKSLPAPPPLLDSKYRSVYFIAGSFVIHNKLYALFHMFRRDRELRSQFAVYCFDPDTECWTQEHYERESDDSFLRSFRLSINGCLRICYPQITVSVPGFINDLNCSIMLSWEPHYFGYDPRQSTVGIYAFLVDQKGVLIRYQLAVELEPTFVYSPQGFLIDLGNGKVCAVFSSSTLEREDSEGILVISVFTLSLKLSEDGDFLHVKILRNHVFTLEDFCLLDAFVCQSVPSFVRPERIVKKLPRLKH